MERDTPPDSLVLEEAHWRALCGHADACVPEEACGILAGRDDRCVSVIPLTNTLHSATAYSVAPEELFTAFTTLENNAWELLGIFHSHPLGEARPSATDVADAHYPGSAYLILARSGNDWLGRAFNIRNGEVTEIPLRVG